MYEYNIIHIFALKCAFGESYIISYHIISMIYDIYIAYDMHVIRTHHIPPYGDTSTYNNTMMHKMRIKY